VEATLTHRQAVVPASVDALQLLVWDAGLGASSPSARIGKGP